MPGPTVPAQGPRQLLFPCCDRTAYLAGDEVGTGGVDVEASTTSILAWALSASTCFLRFCCWSCWLSCGLPVPREGPRLAWSLPAGSRDSKLGFDRLNRELALFKLAYRGAEFGHHSARIEPSQIAALALEPCDLFDLSIAQFLKGPPDPS